MKFTDWGFRLGLPPPEDLAHLELHSDEAPDQKTTQSLYLSRQTPEAHGKPCSHL